MTPPTSAEAAFRSRGARTPGAWRSCGRSCRRSRCPLAWRRTASGLKPWECFGYASVEGDEIHFATTYEALVSDEFPVNTNKPRFRMVSKATHSGKPAGIHGNPGIREDPP